MALPGLEVAPEKASASQVSGGQYVDSRLQVALLWPWSPWTPMTLFE